MAKRRIPDLHIERAADSGNLFFLSVLEYRKENYLVVVDNISEDEVGAYVLDFANQEKIDVKQLISLIIRWFYEASEQRPLSFEFSRLGISPRTNKIYRTFELSHVTRLIGNDFTYNIDEQPTVRRRRVNHIPAGTEVALRRSAKTVHLPKRAE